MPGDTGYVAWVTALQFLMNGMEAISVRLAMIPAVAAAAMHAMRLIITQLADIFS
jgi:hypothetical protein